MASPNVLEFLGGSATVSIIPNFSFEPLHLISGSIGPFRAGLPTAVPLWLAIHLRKRQKCRIVPPDWMDVETLEQIKENEKLSKFFTKMPDEHYLVMAHQIINAASGDVQKCQEICTTLKDVFDVRESKLRTSIDTFIKGEGTYAKLDNLTVFEMNSVRPVLSHCLDHISRYQRSAEVTQRETSMMPQSMHNNTSTFSSH